jgi:hypothetical protein
MLQVGRITLVALCNILSLGSLAIFAWSFFGVKPYLTDLEDGGHQLDILISSESAPFDKIVFMVVDALRRYLHSLPFS